MNIIREAAEIQRIRHSLSGSVALVPTMGALHQGHLHLVQHAKKICEHVFVSIYVNPLQFGPHEDFTTYPRDLDQDCLLLEKLDIDYVFAPENLETHGTQTKIINTKLASLWEGSSRPGHFDGVLTVVSKLYFLMNPTDMIFGQKDYQQTQIIRQWVNELYIPVNIHIHSIVRTENGLALSSRNQKLSSDQLDKAIQVYQALLQAKALFGEGVTDASLIESQAKEVMNDLEIDYFKIIDPKTLQPIDKALKGSVIIVAAKCGQIRLIDNMILC